MRFYVRGGAILKKISTRIIFMATSIVIATAIIIGIFAIRQQCISNDNAVANLDKTMRDTFDAELKDEVQIAVSMLNQVYQRSEKGEITLEQSKKLGADILRNMHYGKDGYFWADMEDGTNVVSNGSSSEGNNRYNLMDNNGTYYIKNIIANGIKENGGYTNYSFHKNGQVHPLPKRGYSLEYRPFKWIIGTGNYLDDINNTISSKRKTLNDELKRNIYIIIFLISVTTIAASLFARYLSKKISEPIVTITELFNSAANGDLAVKCDIDRKDELGVLSNSFNIMIAKMKELIDKIAEAAETVSETSVALAATTDGSQESLESIVTAISDVAVNSANQAKSADEGYDSSNNLLNRIEQLVLTLKNSSEFSKLPISIEDLDVLKSLKKKMLEIAVDICDSSGNIAATSEEVAASVEEQSAASQEINAMAHELSAMAKQLNQSINSFIVK